MSSTAAPLLPPRVAREDEAQFTLYAATVMLLVLAAPTLAAFSLDDRTIDGVSVWDKPLKFELSLALHMATLAVLMSLLTQAARAGWGVRTIASFTAFFALFEVLYIALQAARGRASHFNNETSAEMLMYSLMGVGAVGLVVCAFALGVVVTRSTRPEIGKGLRAGAAIGLLLGAVTTLAVAGLMSSGVLVHQPGHWVGGPRSDADAIPLFGWVRSGGDLRVSHFFATHMIQGLPLLGLVADRIAPRFAVFTVIGGALIGLAIIGATFAQALAGQPLF